MNLDLSPRIKRGLAAAAIALTAGGAGYVIATFSYDQAADPAADPAADASRKILYWYDPMVPSQHFDKPGKSPFMDMQLVPKYADERSEEHTSELQSLMRISYAVFCLQKKTTTSE